MTQFQPSNLLTSSACSIMLKTHADDAMKSLKCISMINLIITNQIDKKRRKKILKEKKKQRNSKKLIITYKYLSFGNKISNNNYRNNYN